MNQPYYPTPPQPKKRRTGLIILLAVCAVMAIAFASCVAVIASSGGDATVAGAGGQTAAGDGDSDNAGSGGEDATTAQVGDTVTSGDLEMTVTNVETTKEVSDDSGFITEEARGKYVIVDVEVTNNGEDSLSFFAAGVPLVDPDGNEHDSTVDVAIVRGDSDLAEPVNPGSTAQGFIAYDVPEDTKVEESHIEVSGGFLDEPVQVRLR